MFESMFNTVFNTAAANTSISLVDAILTIVIAFVLGGITSFTYMKTSSEKDGYSQNFAVTLVIIPAVIAIIVLLIGSNVARAFSLAGAFSIIKFRSTSGDPKDLSYVLLTMAVGLACGVGFYGYGIIFTIFLCLLLVGLSVVKFGEKKVSTKLLKIMIPEDLDYEGAFDDVFSNFTLKSELIKVKTTDLGSLYQLSYLVSMNNEVSQKEFLDTLRCRNGNLNITLSMTTTKSDY